MPQSTQSGELPGLPGQPHRTEKWYGIPRRLPGNAPSAPVVQIPKYVPTNSHVLGTIAFALLYGTQP
jgi:hypothetical protein